MPLRAEFVEENLAISGDLSLFGIKVNDLTREELIACCVMLAKSEKRQRDEAYRRRTL